MKFTITAEGEAFSVTGREIEGMKRLMKNLRIMTSGSFGFEIFFEDAKYEVIDDGWNSFGGFGMADAISDL